ncbi:GNAT family N-acetyltransferase [Thermosipho affectus]|uniref:GNAT family N-acetyltransferase n=1 Tax=Thermosipho affectus TaxID=660294 RepID=UPI000980EF3F|nr:N-acetyltransferase [Thermosipho affectus]
MIRKINKDDDLLKVAELIYDTDERLFYFLFGKREEAILKLAELVKREGNPFSYRNVYGYFDGKEIKGILIAYDLEKRCTKGKIKDFFEVFSFFKLVDLFVKNILINNIINLKGLKGIYIQNISVDKKSRGKGIGTKLLEYFIKETEKKGYRGIYLDVEKNNRAKNLYLRKGFKIIKEKKALMGKFKIYRMKKE